MKPIVFYRMCGIPSTNPSPIFQEDKFKLNQLCLRSFLQAFKDVDIEVVYLLDHCDARYKLWIKSIHSKAIDIIETNIGINETCLLQYKLFEERTNDTVLFAECDYLWLPGSGKRLLDVTKELPFVSPYDHPDKYLGNYVDEKVYIKLAGGHHWKSTVSTTSTFATTRKHFMEKKDIFYKHGYIDHARWQEIDIWQKSLYTPMPSLATHMVASQLASNIDWKTEWEKYL